MNDPPEWPRSDERKPGILGADELGELPQRCDPAAQPTGSGLPELGGVAPVLCHAGATVAAVVIGIDRVAVGGERIDERGVPSGVLAHAVQQLDDRTGRGLRGMDVVDDRDAVCIDELGHAHESRVRHAAPRAQFDRGTAIYLARLMS